MIYPITVYGLPVLKKVASEITPDYPNLSTVIENMYKTLTNAEGVGLAAPQVNLSIKLFIVDLTCLAEENPIYKDFKKTFINPEITFYSEEEEKGEEGCLSLPGISEPVKRSKKIRIKYQDENFEWHDEEYENFFARVIQHEYDHLQGKVFIDRISPIRRQMNRSKISAMLKGKVRCRYNVKTV
ncbi:MAG: peptide deformylase [Bacteroidales bacterium]|jgi:peptide deformylase|nr:peptide deformylase [Bacteroidales bacterium]MEE1062949.1 peptide deformylase [Paludibacteraceae bacterium]